MKKVTSHQAVTETAVEIKKVIKKVNVPDEREARLKKCADENESKNQEEAYREFMAPSRREAAASALWEMYRHGELILQTIEIGGLRKDVLFSHKSIYAV